MNKSQQKKISNRKKRVAQKLLKKRTAIRSQARVDNELDKIKKESEYVTPPIRNQYVR